MRIDKGLLAFLAIIAAPAVGQVKDEDIVVTGQSQTHDNTRDAAKAFVREVSATPVSGQFARWRDPVCPKTIGIAPENAAIVTERIRTVAREAGVRLDKPKCKTNLLIVFTDNGDRDIAALRKASPRLFGTTGLAERRLLDDPSRAARWWYATRIEGIDGHQMGGTTAALLGATNSPSAGGTSLSGGLMSNGETGGIDGYNSSLIGTRVRAKIESATFIVDANIASGRSLKSIAAYAALVTLSRIKMDGAGNADESILTLFSDDERRPDDLTDQDKAFLTALYSVPPNRDARTQEQAIATAMTKLLERRD